LLFKSVYYASFAAYHAVLLAVGRPDGMLLHCVPNSLRTH